uniref:Uncharacterized protein n=1 Tax=Utricularia reniformis TaxID=192314 RepID=A0A1Y0B1F4_9LAMI|nr:hypothetical protein AEK19_MT1064 [Utricularia reniformis]ART31286.1 hypothetical protein AEK19_MT1064 [Utricularia reniformis]
MKLLISNTYFLRVSWEMESLIYWLMRFSTPIPKEGRKSRNSLSFYGSSS